jgi:hypothetical protein
MKKLLLFLLAISLSVSAQTTKIRSVTVLPATCQPGDGVQATDIVALSIGGNTQQYICSSTNTWTAVPGGGLAQAQVVASGLIGQFPLTEGAGTTINDVSGSGNNGTLCAAAPTWIANTGGLSFTRASTQCATFPSALNSAVTIQVFVGWQWSIFTGNSEFNCLVCGNNASGASGTAGLIIEEVTYGQVSNQMRPQLLSWGNAAKTISQAQPPGIFMATVVQSSVAADTLYVNGTATINKNAPSPGSGGLQTLGVYQLGGRVPITGSFNSWFQGQIYYVLFYNRALSATEVAQNYAAVSAALGVRGVSVGETNTFQGNQIFSDGDSIQDKVNGWGEIAQFTSTPGSWYVIYPNLTGSGVQTLSARGNAFQFGMLPAFGTGTYHIQIGANNLAASPADQTFIQDLAAYSLLVKSRGYKVVVETVMDHTGLGSNTWHDNFNLQIRTMWPNFADALADTAADPVLGADGAFANATYSSDGTHPTEAGQVHRGAIIQRAINRLYGNHSFSTANTYSASASAATAITAASETGNLITLTFASTPFVAGQMVRVAGVTPSGYNGVWPVKSVTATTAVLFDDTTGLGAGTVFGTAVAPQMQDVDQYIILGGAGAGLNFTLETCMGYTGQNIYLKNTNGNSWTVTPDGTETIDGAASLTVTTGSTAVLQSVLATPASPTCSWKKIN